MDRITDLTINDLLRPEGFSCACGKHHRAGVRQVAIGAGTIERLPDILKSFAVKKPFLVMDGNTKAVAGDRACMLLEGAGIGCVPYCFPQERVEPDEFSIGQAVLAFDSSCDMVVSVGSGTINDICKVISNRFRIPQVVVATAPSMDGYASNSSALIWGGVKSTVYVGCPSAIIADTDIICQAPMRMIQAGLGDILAKYNSICEWRISHLVNGEYYCEEVAQLMRSAVRKCAAQAQGLARRDPAAVQAVTEGLILSGIAMSFAEVSRPASGLEHYFSHIWEMRALAAHEHSELHGNQVGVGTLLARRVYSWLGETEPSEKKALEAVAKFDMESWSSEVRRIFGSTAPSIIALERECGKHDVKKHAQRLKSILLNWPGILQIIREELPPYETLEGIILTVGGSVTPAAIGITPDGVKEALSASMEIRDKYIGSRLLWDLGLIDEMGERLKKLCETMK